MNLKYYRAFILHLRAIQSLQQFVCLTCLLQRFKLFNPTYQITHRDISSRNIRQKIFILIPVNIIPDVCVWVHPNPKSHTTPDVSKYHTAVPLGRLRLRDRPETTARFSAVAF